MRYYYPGEMCLDKKRPLAYKWRWRGNNSVVECNLAKVKVAGSNPVSRSSLFSQTHPPSLRLMKWCFFFLEYIFLSFLLVPKERTKEKAPREPALRVRSLAWKIRAAAELASFHSAQTDAAVPPDFPALAHRVQGEKRSA